MYRETGTAQPPLAPDLPVAPPADNSGALRSLDDSNWDNAGAPFLPRAAEEPMAVQQPRAEAIRRALTMPWQVMKSLRNSSRAKAHAGGERSAHVFGSAGAGAANPTNHSHTSHKSTASIRSHRSLFNIDGLPETPLHEIPVVSFYPPDVSVTPLHPVAVSLPGGPEGSRLGRAATAASPAGVAAQPQHISSQLLKADPQQPRPPSACWQHRPLPPGSGPFADSSTARWPLTEPRHKDHQRLYQHPLQHPQQHPQQQQQQHNHHENHQQHPHHRPQLHHYYPPAQPASTARAPPDGTAAIGAAIAASAGATSATTGTAGLWGVMHDLLGRAVSTGGRVDGTGVVVGCGAAGAVPSESQTSGPSVVQVVPSWQGPASAAAAATSCLPPLGPGSTMRPAGVEPAPGASLAPAGTAAMIPLSVGVASAGQPVLAAVVSAAVVPLVAVPAAVAATASPPPGGGGGGGIHHHHRCHHHHHRQQQQGLTKWDDARNPMSLYYDPSLDLGDAPPGGAKGATAAAAAAAAAPAASVPAIAPRPPSPVHPPVPSPVHPQAAGSPPAAAGIWQPHLGAGPLAGGNYADSSGRSRHRNETGVVQANGAHLKRADGNGDDHFLVLEMKESRHTPTAAAAAAAAYVSGASASTAAPDAAAAQLGMTLSLRGRLRSYFSKWRGVGDTLMPAEQPVDVFWSWLGAFLSILLVALLNQYLSPRVDLPLLIASFGASAVLLFGVPVSKLAQPRNFLGGQVVSAVVGVLVRLAFMDAYRLVWLSAALGMSLALAAMQFTRTTHPPGGASALIAASAVNIGPWHGFKFVLTVFFGCIAMLAVALLVNNVSSRRRYPTYWWGRG